MIFFLCSSLIGICLGYLLPLNIDSANSLPAIEIDFNMPGNAARVVEAEATSKLESMLSRIKGIRNLYSTSGNGWGKVTIEFDRYTRMDLARFETSNIIRQTWPRLPREVSYPEIYLKKSNVSSSRPFLSYTINADLSNHDIQKFAERNYKEAFKDLEGLESVDIGGALPMEWRLEYNYNKLQSYGISVWDIQRAIQETYQTKFIGTGEISGNASYGNLMRTSLKSDQNESIFDAAKLMVSNNNGSLIQLDKLVEVKHSEKKPSKYYRVNGLNSIYIAFTAKESSNQLKLGERIKYRMSGLNKTLPAGYQVHVRYDTTTFVTSQLKEIALRSAISFALLLILIFVYWRNVGLVLMIVASLFISILSAFSAYYVLGINIQAYSLGAIGISFALIADNIHSTYYYLLKNNNRSVLSTLSSISFSSCGVFTIMVLLDKPDHLNIQEFLMVITINIMVSWFVALFFIPSIIDYFKVGPIQSTGGRNIFLRKPVRKFLYDSYSFWLRFILARRKIVVSVLILVFGLPVYLLPENLDSESRFGTKYNELVKTDFYRESLRPALNKALGGVSRLFYQYVVQTSHPVPIGETVLKITASMPSGTQLSQMNELVLKMESFVSQFDEVRLFQTNVYGTQKAGIEIFFKDPSISGSALSQIKDKIITKAIELGGGSWGVFGGEDQSFNNEFREKAGQFKVKLYGFNYDELSFWANKLSDQLSSHKRVGEVFISSNFSEYKDDYEEFLLNIDNEHSAVYGLSPYAIYNSVRPALSEVMFVTSIKAGDGREDLFLCNSQLSKVDLWGLVNINHSAGSSMYKLDEVAKIEKKQAPRQIEKENQQYRLTLQFNYIGWSERGNEVLEREIDTLKRHLPLGYSVFKEDQHFNWDMYSDNQFLTIGLIAVVIFFFNAILLNSVKQAFAVVAMIPISFIGFFLLFYWLRINFDQGGHMAMLILSAISSNSSIHIIASYNNIRRKHYKMNGSEAFLEACISKMPAIAITIFAMITALVPFMIFSHNETFWYALSVGIIGGLLTSFIGTMGILPILILKKVKKNAD